MFELSQAGCQSSAYLPKRMCLSQLTEQHRYELAPATESFYAFLGSCFPYSSDKILMRKYCRICPKILLNLFMGMSSFRYRKSSTSLLYLIEDSPAITQTLSWTSLIYDED